MEHRGAGLVAGYSVLHDGARPPTGIVVADVEGGQRVVAVCDDPSLVARMEQDEFCGVPIRVDGGGFAMAEP